eukprot:646111-Prorocentrum_minimum.AAC.1
MEVAKLPPSRGGLTLHPLLRNYDGTTKTWVLRGEAVRPLLKMLREDNGVAKVTPPPNFEDQVLPVSLLVRSPYASKRAEARAAACRLVLLMSECPLCWPQAWEARAAAAVAVEEARRAGAEAEESRRRAEAETVERRRRAADQQARWRRQMGRQMRKDAAEELAEVCGFERRENPGLNSPVQGVDSPGQGVDSPGQGVD